MQLRLLQVIGQTGSVGAAARRVGLTQSGASQSIATLEKILGVELIARRRDGAALTAFARSILGEVETVLSAVERIEALARNRMAAPATRLRVAAIPSEIECRLPAVRRAFQQMHPDVEFVTFEGGHEDVSLWVRDGVADVGVTSLPLPELAATAIGEEELVIVGRRDDPLMRGETLAVEALRDRPMLAAAGSEGIIGRLVQSSHSEGLRTHDIATVLEMVRQGVGLTLLSEISLPGADLRDLRAMRLTPPAFRTVYVVSRPGSALTPLIEGFRDAIAGPPAGHKKN